MPTTSFPSRMRPSARENGRRGEAGLTIIEVMVAVFVLMVVASAIAMATVGGNKYRGAARLQSALTSSGQQVQEDVIADREWMKEIPGCKVIDRPCDISSYVSRDALSLDDVSGEAELVSATSTALDSDVDDLGSRDEDGIIPDYYRIAIELQPSADVARRYSVPATESRRRFVTTIDRRGAEQVGSIAVEVCRSDNQADERLQLQGCAQSGPTHVAMLNCEPTAAACDASRPEVFGDCAPGSFAECRRAFAWINHRAASNASPKGPAPFVSMVRVQSISFRLVNVDNGASIPSGDAKMVDGVFVFQNVPAGEFRLVGLPASVSAGGGTFERWTSKEIPAFHGSSADPADRATIAVDPGVRTKALVMFRPATTRAGIDLFFQRKTRTYRLNGPRTASEVSVPEMAPTDGYQGASADSYCDHMKGSSTDQSQFTTYDCVGIVPVGKNCVELLVEGTFYREVGEGNGDTHYLYPDIITGEMGSGNYLKKSTNGPTPAMRFCTFYAEYLEHTYYGQVTEPPYDTRDGAAKANTYFVEPAPEARHVEYGPSGPYLATPQCEVEWKGQCTAGGPEAPHLRAGLKPGLNTEMQNVDAAAAATNAFFSRTPAWLTTPMWVHPSGSFESRSGGTRPAGSRWTFVGLGECYWRGPNYSGERIGECDPCSPLWKVGWTVDGACAILTRTEWERPAWETITSLNWQGDVGGSSDSFTKPIEGKKGVITYDPVWQCTTRVPRVAQGATCKETPRGGGPKFIPNTTHKSSNNGGTGLVNRKAFGPGGGT